MVWPTFGSRTAKKQNRIRQRCGTKTAVLVSLLHSIMLVLVEPSSSLPDLFDSLHDRKNQLRTTPLFTQVFVNLHHLVYKLSSVSQQRV